MCTPCKRKKDLARQRERNNVQPDLVLCIDCGEVPPRPRQSATGVAPSRCQSCHESHLRKVDRELKAVVRANETLEQKSDRSAYMKEWREGNQDKVEGMRWRARLKKYGITEEDFKGMWEEQQGCCKICRTELLLGGTQSDSNQCVIDHHHETGQVRGLLCRTCNLGIGYFNDNADMLRAAAEFLENAGDLGRVTRRAA